MERPASRKKAQIPVPDKSIENWTLLALIILLILVALGIVLVIYWFVKSGKISGIGNLLF